MAGVGLAAVGGPAVGAAANRGDAPLVLARAPLATLPAVFSETSLQSHVSTLSAAEYEGRGIGTAGMEKAAAYLAAQFKAVGLAPGMPGGSYRQAFTTTQTRDGKPATLANIVGVLQGSDPAWRDQSVVVMAHYDHLGLGWPNPRAGDEGKLHPGADDNASGVAVLLEVARAMAAAGCAAADRRVRGHGGRGSRHARARSTTSRHQSVP